MCPERAHRGRVWGHRAPQPLPWVQTCWPTTYGCIHNSQSLRGLGIQGLCWVSFRVSLGATIGYLTGHGIHVSLCPLSNAEMNLMTLY